VAFIFYCSGDAMKSIFVVGARGIPDAEGGVEKNAEKLFPRIAKRGWHITLAGLKTHIASHSYCGVKLLAFPALRVLKTDKLIYYIFAIIYAARKRPDIVHLAGLGSALFLWVFRLLGCKTVVRYGSADYVVGKWNWLGRAGFLMAEYQLRRADAIIAVTPALVDRLNERGIYRNIHIITNALDEKGGYVSERVNSLPKNYILSVGRVTAQKNYHKLISAFLSSGLEKKGLKLVIVGGLDDKSYLQSLSSLQLESVILTGRLKRSALEPIYRNAKLYICSSIHEGNSNAVLEAIGFQCPILLSDIEENRDFKLDNHHYFDPQAENAIQNAISQCEQSPVRYVAKCNHFPNWDQVADRTEDIYNKISIHESDILQVPHQE